MAWTKYSNAVVFASNNQNFKILDGDEEQIILGNNPFALLTETYQMLDEAYLSSDSTGVNIGIQRLEGLLQLDFIKSNQQKIRALLSLYFGYSMYKDSSQGRFKTYVNWDSFSSHCNKYFPSVSKFKGKTFSSVSGIAKFFNDSLNNATVKEYAEISGWYSESEYRYFEDKGIFDFLAGTEADNKASSKNPDATIKSMFLLGFTALFTAAFFLPTYNFSGNNNVSGYSALFDTGIFFDADGWGQLSHWHLMVGSLIALSYGFYAINLLIILANSKSKIFFILSGIALYGSIFLFGYEWYASGSFVSFFHKAGLGFYLGTIGALVAQFAWGEGSD